jgi:hypothetical protein
MYTFVRDPVCCPHSSPGSLALVCERTYDMKEPRRVPRREWLLRHADMDYWALIMNARMRAGNDRYHFIFTPGRVNRARLKRSWCGSPDTFEGVASGLCATCAKEGWLGQRLDDDSICVHITHSAAFFCPGYGQYKITSYGIAVRDHPPDCPFPFYGMGFQRWGAVILRQKISMEGSALHVIRRSDEEGYFTADMLGLAKRSTGDVELLTRGLDIVELQFSRGRPRGSGYFRDADECREAFRTAIKALQQQGRTVTQESVATYFSNHNNFPTCDARQLRAWCRHFHLSWDQIRKSE